ncbi:hypothetical protein AB3508_13345 [Acinetobacter baumannii]
MIEEHRAVCFKCSVRLSKAGADKLNRRVKIELVTPTQRYLKEQMKPVRPHIIKNNQNNRLIQNVIHHFDNDISNKKAVRLVSRILDINDKTVAADL